VREWTGYNSGYTRSMKTAVSVPDDLFRLAEVAARRLRVSRSQLYATAISEFLNRQQGDAVTERLNEVYSHRPERWIPRSIAPTEIPRKGCLVEMDEIQRERSGGRSGRTSRFRAWISAPVLVVQQTLSTAAAFKRQLWP